MGQRHRARELALQVLFQREFVPEMELEKRLEYFRDHFEAGADVMKYASKLAKGVLENQADIDKNVAQHSEHWSLSRMSLVDLSILRIAAFEITMLNEVPPKVALNEAIELAKKYGNFESPGFVNGILDDLLKGQA